MYSIYTLPTCEECHKAIELMKQRGIPFEQINAGSSEGIKKFREFYTNHREQIKRDDSGTTVLPVIAYQNGDLSIHQGIEGLENFLELNKK